MKHILVLGSGPQPATAPLPPHLRELAAGDLHWRLEGTRVGGFPYTPLDALMTETGHVDAALRLRDADTRAVLVDTFGEYGVTVMRSALDIPVVGSAEAALAESRQHGERFGIVTVWPASLDWLYRRQLLLHEAAARCVGIRYVGDAVAREPQPVETLGAMRRGEPQWLQLIEAGMRDLVAQGARSIVLGCTCMSPVWGQLRHRAGVPVICAARAGAQAALAAARSAPALQPTASLATRAAFARWVDQGAGAAPDADAASCPVCITEPQ
jgi:Asp/Glu/hydantoin racemase